MSNPMQNLVASVLSTKHELEISIVSLQTQIAQEKQRKEMYENMIKTVRDAHESTLRDNLSDEAQIDLLIDQKSSLESDIEHLKRHAETSTQLARQQTAQLSKEVETLSSREKEVKETITEADVMLPRLVEVLKSRVPAELNKIESLQKQQSMMSASETIPLITQKISSLQSSIESTKARINSIKSSIAESEAEASCYTRYPALLIKAVQGNINEALHEAFPNTSKGPLSSTHMILINDAKNLSYVPTSSPSPRTDTKSKDSEESYSSDQLEPAFSLCHSAFNHMETRTKALCQVLETIRFGPTPSTSCATCILNEESNSSKHDHPTSNHQRI